jgi:hypothetical protein
VADDSPSNPDSSALSTERLSDPFDVDNNPPVIEAIQGSPSGNSLKLEFTVEDSFSNVGEVIYSVNAREWEVVPPVDGITDSPKETYRVELTNLPQGEVTFVVKASDTAGNSATAKKVVHIGGSH